MQTMLTRIKTQTLTNTKIKIYRQLKLKIKILKWNSTQNDEDRLLHQKVRIGVYKEELTQKDLIVEYRKRVVINGGQEKKLMTPFVEKTSRS